MRKVDENLKKKLANATVSVKNFLRPLSSLSDDDVRKVIRRYTAAIEGNFLAWMGGASISARSVVSKFAADENLWVEIRDDHPSMLRNFAKCTKTEPDAEDFQYVHSEVMKIRNLVGELSGVKNIALIATLENTSTSFIPYLAELAKRLGCTDLTYTDIHGEADIEHANQFLEALSDEQNQGYQSAEKEIDDTLALTLGLLKKIFS